ncbi:MAG: hypothetical protein IJV18_00810 [Acidaminococcaceae bacterium]|nr:hypothetical protein [Acidaminococcaceae bacterium]
MENKIVKYALFYYESDYCGDAELDEIGCPDYSFPFFKNRIALAEWFLTNGMQYFSGEKDGIKYFYYKGSWRHTVAIIDLDISRPWCYHSSDDPEWPWERIMYLDRVDADNRIYPEVYPSED